jgi:hypothetical protein
VYFVLFVVLSVILPNLDQMNGFSG